jgi:hypothetical protein
MIVAIESEPRTGKGYIYSLMCRSFGYTPGNVPMSDTLKGLTQLSLQSWCFEYLLSIILNFIQPTSTNVVYKNLLVEHTLLQGFWQINYITDNEMAILRRCCNLFIPDVTPDIVIYSSADENLLASFYKGHDPTEKHNHFMTCVDISRSFKVVFKKVLCQLKSSILKLSSECPYMDSVVRASIISEIGTALNNLITERTHVPVCKILLV